MKESITKARVFNLEHFTAIKQPSCEKIEHFLEVPLPEDFYVGPTDDVYHLNAKDMEPFIMQRGPLFFIKKAIAIKNRKRGVHCVLGLAPMNKEQIHAYFPERPVAPLFELSHAMTQTGIILAAMHCTHGEIPIAKYGKELLARGDSFTNTSANALIMARLLNNEANRHFTIKNETYVKGKPTGAMRKSSYTVISREQFMPAGHKTS